MGSTSSFPGKPAGSTSPRSGARVHFRGRRLDQQAQAERQTLSVPVPVPDPDIAAPNPIHLPTEPRAARSWRSESRRARADGKEAPRTAESTPAASSFSSSDMPPKQKKKKKPGSKQPTDVKPTEVYEVHEESFMGKPTLILRRKQLGRHGRCPLLGLGNLLFLRHRGTRLLATLPVKRTDGTKYVSGKKLNAFVLDRCTEMVKANDPSMTDLDRDELLKEYQVVLEKLRSSTGMDEHFCGIGAYGSTIERSKNMFKRLDIIRRHAVLPDPKDALEYSTVKDENCGDLFIECYDYVDGCKNGEQYEHSYHERMTVVKKFIWDMPKFTSYGMGRLREEAHEKELFLLHLNDDLHVVYKRDGQLYLLATEEDVRVKYPDIMWFGLDEKFDDEHPETARKFTNTFAPVNEVWTSTSDLLLQELEEEKRRDKMKTETTVSQVEAETSFIQTEVDEELEDGKRREVETSVSQVEAETTCLQTQVDTDGSKVKTVQDPSDTHKVVEIKTVQDSSDTHKVVEIKTVQDSSDPHKVVEIKTVQDSRDTDKVVEMKRPEIVVDRRFLRFVNRRVVLFKTFTSYYKMYRIYDFKGRKFLSTSYLGRLMAKGYLVFILDVHKSGFSWNGKFKEEDMMVELEIVDGVAIRALHFFIKLTPYDGFSKEYGVADLDRYVEFLFPKYLCEGFKEPPCYFSSFEADIRDMPDCDAPLEKLEKFHKYMRDHFFAKAPLARSTVVSDTYGLCDSEIVHIDQNLPKPRYGPLDVEVITSLFHQLSIPPLSSPSQLSPSQLYFSDPLNSVYSGSRVEIHITGSLRWTCWDLIALGRHSKQHMMDKTQINGVQEMDDPILIDLIVEKDLKGLLTQAIKLMMQKTNFEGRFESTWRYFCGSESKDDGELIPFLIPEDECVKVAEEVVMAESVARAESVATQEPEVKVAEELDATAMQAAATGPKDGGGRIPFAAAETQRFIENDYGTKLTEQGLKSLDRQTWVLDEVISFVYGELSAAVINLQDIMLVPVSQAHALTNLPSDSNPSEILPVDYSMYLFPVNDSVNHKWGDTGNHWSLLVLRLDWSRKECRCVHHDSIEGKNRATADRLVENLKRLFPTFHINCIQGQTPQQANLYDCGVYVIAISHQIAMWYKRVKNREKEEEDWIADVSKVTPKSVSDRRLQLYVNLKKRFRLRYPGHFEEESNNEGGSGADLGGADAL